MKYFFSELEKSSESYSSEMDSKKISRTHSPIDSFIPDSDELNEEGKIEVELVDFSIQTHEYEGLNDSLAPSVIIPIQDSKALLKPSVESEYFSEIPRKEHIDDVVNSLVEETNDEASLSYDENISLLVAAKFIEEDDSFKFY